MGLKLNPLTGKFEESTSQKCLQGKILDSILVESTAAAGVDPADTSVLTDEDNVLYEEL
jgi:hypothetical protein